MEVINYQFMTEVNNGTEEHPVIKKIFKPFALTWNEINEETAKREAYNGEYTIEDDGQPEPEPEPTQLDRVEAQTTYTAMMTDTLLEV